eukprot:GFYU01034723.1.p1 GENE.GFYU01034723.1~~GFYU01034723.1.p1  ORF type:complete len:282 (+),score=31.56 GFYU01034723.1:30-875(+)
MAVVESDDLYDPCPDIRELFLYYNDVYFKGNLSMVAVEWSGPRMTSCAGICSYEGRGGLCRIRLSKPILQFRNTSDVKDTLLHEMIHAFQFVTKGNRDHDDHGEKFQAIMRSINASRVPDMYRPQRGYKISIYHSFMDEVNLYLVHWWTCNKCGHVVKRSVNRTPCENECWIKRAKKQQKCTGKGCPWHNHAYACGGDYVKSKEPEGYVDKRKGARAANNNTKTQGRLLGSGDSGAGAGVDTTKRPRGEDHKPGTSASDAAGGGGGVGGGVGGLAGTHCHR